MYYVLTPLSTQLIFIRWNRVQIPNCKPQRDFIDEIQQRLDEAAQPLYFLSDLRFGQIKEMSILQRLGRLTYHPNYGGGSAFSKDVMADLFVGAFSRFADPGKGESVFYDTMPEACGYLERLAPGITDNIDWSGVLT